MVLVSQVLIGIGLISWAALLVIGAVALTRDWLSERAKTSEGDRRHTARAGEPSHPDVDPVRYLGLPPL